MYLEFLKQVIKDYGILNVRIFGPGQMFDLSLPYIGLGLVSSDSPEFRTEFVIVEERYKLSGNYKIELKPVDPRFSVHKFYQSDFQNRFDRGQYDVYVLTIDGYMPVHVTVKEVINNEESKIIRWFKESSVFQQLSSQGD